MLTARLYIKILLLAIVFSEKLLYKGRMNKKINKPYHKKVGNQIRFYRKEKGLTQEQLSLEIGNANSYIAIVENAQRDLPLSQIHKIAKVLEIEPWQLLKFD